MCKQMMFSGKKTGFTELSEHADAAVVDSVCARGPRRLQRAAEVGAVVPGGALPKAERSEAM